MNKSNIKHLTCFLFCFVGTVIGRFTTDQKQSDEVVGENWTNDPEYPETDGKTFTTGI